MSSFEEGYRFFLNNAGGILGAIHGAESELEREGYIASIEHEIQTFENNINSFEGHTTPPQQLKGDVAEYWHAGSFNVNAAMNNSDNRFFVNRSYDLGSVDVSSSFGESASLKYYGTGVESAKQQAKSIFERYRFYQSNGGKDSFEIYLRRHRFTSTDVLNDPLYSGQIRVIPADQLEEATNWLKKMIATEGLRRPDQVKRYQETLNLLSDRLRDNNGNESIPLSREDAEKLAVLAKEGDFEAKEWGITAPELLNMEFIIKESLKSGLSAAVISLVLKIGPELIKSIDYLIKRGELDEEDFHRVGFTAIHGATEAFVRGSIASAITVYCKSGILGETLKSVSAGVIGTIVALTMNTLKNSYQVAIGNKTRTELSNDLIRDLILSSTALLCGHIGVVILHQLPMLGYLLGSFVGSVVGSFIYDNAQKTVISFCTETGITLFGIVKQDYKLPDDIIEEMGLEKFEYEKVQLESLEPETFSYESFEPETFEIDNIGITFLKRGVIGVSRIGYVTTNPYKKSMVLPKECPYCGAPVMQEVCPYCQSIIRITQHGNEHREIAPFNSNDTKYSKAVKKFCV